MTVTTMETETKLGSESICSQGGVSAPLFFWTDLGKITLGDVDFGAVSRRLVERGA